MESGKSPPVEIGNEPEVSEAELGRLIAAFHTSATPNLQSSPNPDASGSPCSECDHSFHLGEDFYRLICTEDLDMHGFIGAFDCPQFKDVKPRRG
jgi:hypothetical protein